MLKVFVIFALVAFAASQLLPHLARGMGIDAMLIYLLLGTMVVVYRLIKLARR